MFMKKIFQKTNSEIHLKSGSLKPSDLEPRLTAHHGIPASASVLAYEPSQRLLAIGSRDGRIKIFGRDGVEHLFQSPTKAPCKFLEFVSNEGRLIHITTRNDIEVWDLSAKELVAFKNWGAEVTAFAVIQGTPFLYIGDETGEVAILEFHADHSILTRMEYSIPAHVTLRGLVDSEDANAPSVVSILPQAHSRVCFVYGNGIIILWGLFEAQVLAIRGGNEEQLRKLAGEHTPASNSEEEKEPCCACWACPSSSVVAVGYTDGDIWLWSLPINSKSKAEKQDASSLLENESSKPLKLSLSSEEFRMPVVVMRWAPSFKAEKSEKRPSGYLYVFGGQEMGMAEVVTVLSLGDPSSQIQLRLRGPFADIFVLNGAALLLTSPGCLDVYEETSIQDALSSTERSPPQPITFQLPLTSSHVTTTKLVIVLEQSILAAHILKMPRVLKGYMPHALPSGTRWSINGGTLSSNTVSRKLQPSLYITGHTNGLVNVWDASTPCLYFLTTVDNRGLIGSELTSISAIDFCNTSGILAVGDESGLVFVYSICAEAREGTCHFISTNEPSTKRDVQHAPGFQCLAVINLHQATITNLLVASETSCITIGDDVGMVTIFDLESSIIRFHGKCGAAASIVSFTVMKLPSNESSTSTTPRKQEYATSSIFFVLSKDASITALDGTSGNTLGSGCPKNSSTAISLHLLDPSGAALGALTRTPTKKVTKQSFVVSVIETDNSGSHIEPATFTEERDEDTKENDDWTGADSLLLLCSEDSLRLYSISSVLQGMRTTIRKVRLEKPCCFAATFESQTRGFGILLLYDTAEVEIRSLPELDVLKISTLTDCLQWEFGISPSFFKTFSLASNGRLAAIDADRELLFMSIVADENDMRLPDSYPLLHDKDIAAATEAALKANVQTPRKKQSHIQDLLGGVMKEIKHTLGGGERTVLELPKLFSKQIGYGASSTVYKAKAVVSSPEPVQTNERHASPSPEPELDIDDIEIDDEDHSPSPSPSPLPSPSTSSKKGGVMKKLRSSFNKGKKKAGKMDEDEERNMLFEGGSTDYKPAAKSPPIRSSEESSRSTTPRMPAVRTAEEIKAAYGHARSGEASSIAAHARDRLMERQERLQNISRRTEEMQEGAENFASLAEELAKKMESRKWWEI